MTVITISRQYASEGDDIARQLCDRLGYRYLDKDTMGHLGAQAGSVALVQNYIRATHGQAGAVVVGRGGQVELRDMPDVLHVRVVAPLEMRIRRVQEKEGLTAEEARNRVNERDQASAGWVKHTYDADPADAALYDLVISTGKISPATAADLVIQAMACLPVLT
jgi:hypothetical protein